jgi:6-phosphogluconolactonase
VPLFRIELALPALLVVFLCPARGASEDFYIGTVTEHSASQGIYQGSLDTHTGKLGPLHLANEIKNPNFLAVVPDGRFLYAAISTRGASSVAAFARRPDGTLAFLNERPSGGEEAVHLETDATGRDVFVANYGGGNIAGFRTNSDGSLEPRTAFVQFTGSGPNLDRQKKPYAHSIYVGPDNRFVYACDLGSDHVWIFKLDAARGTLAPADPPAAKVPPGSGPRHLAFSPDGRFVYVANEMGGSVTVFSRDAVAGALTALETISALPPGISAKGVSTAEIFCHPSGKWLYVSNRGCDTISVFAIALDGGLELIQSVPSVARFPRSFALDPEGRWLIVAGQKDNRIAVLKIDPATGRLTATDQAAEVGIPTCVIFAPR